MRNTYNILVLGGCHVVGFPYGEDKGFAGVLGQHLRLERDVTMALVPYVNFHRMDAAISRIAMLNPDLVVAQLGHYETTVRLRKWLHARLGLTRAATGTKNAQTEHATSELTLTLFMRAKMLLTDVLDRTMPGSLVDVPTMITQVESVLPRLASVAGERVLILSPLGCLDPTTRRYRRMLSRHMQATALRCGLSYVDVQDALNGTRSNWADDGHLSMQGHQRLGQLLVPIVQQKIATMSCRKLSVV